MRLSIPYMWVHSVWNHTSRKAWEFFDWNVQLWKHKEQRACLVTGKTSRNGVSTVHIAHLRVSKGIFFNMYKNRQDHMLSCPWALQSVGLRSILGWSFFTCQPTHFSLLQPDLKHYSGSPIVHTGAWFLGHLLMSSSYLLWYENIFSGVRCEGLESKCC